MDLDSIVECGSVTCNAREPLPEPYFQIQVQIQVNNFEDDFGKAIREGRKQV